MPIEQLSLLVGAVVLLGIFAVLLLLRATGRPVSTGRDAGARDASPPRDPHTHPEDTPDVPALSALDRVVRVVSLLFLAGAGIAVTLSQSFGPTGVAIYLVLAVAILAVVFVGDMLPETYLRGFRQALQVSVAIGVVTLLVALTGGVRSPFVAGYFLIVGGAALSSDDAAPTLMAIASGLAYLLVASLLPGREAIGPPQVAWAIFNVVALGLLAYIATVAGLQQRRAREAAFRLARFDPLTGLFTRTYLFSTIEREIARATRIGRGFCLLMLDLDDLKPVNDTFGHPVGDRVLRGITDVIRRSIRQTDLAARYGGDEFVIVLPETDAAGALTVAEKLRADVAGMAIRIDTRVIRTSVSIGLVVHPDDGATVEDLMASVDAAMYESKRRGKNQIVGYVTRTERVATPAGVGPVAAPAGVAPPGAVGASQPASPVPPVARAVAPVPPVALPGPVAVPIAATPVPIPNPVSTLPPASAPPPTAVELTVSDPATDGPPHDRRIRYEPSAVGARRVVGRSVQSSRTATGGRTFAPPGSSPWRVADTDDGRPPPG